ncbi:MAG: hypothetical protein KOO61_09890 [Spirochaetales bacterium]|nr:hypothetical protein [Spirochaetales bacterium]
MSTHPDYASFEPNAREELLSQIGSFSPLERTLFQRLCESWEPIIDRDRFISRVGGSEQEVSALDRLMSKLRGAQLGLVTTTVVDEKRVPAGIVLTNKGDLSFYMNLLEEETNKLLGGGYRVLPSISWLEQQKAVPPDYHITDADSIALANAYLAESPEEGILRVRLLGEFRILTSSRFVRTFIEAAVGWLRTNLDERGFLEEIARLKDTSIMELKQRLPDSTPDLWLDLTRSIVQERSTIAFRKNIQENDELFQTAFLIMNFTDAQMGAERARKEDDARVDEELTVLAEAVEKVPSGQMAPEDFSLLVDQAEDRLKRASTEFTRRMTNETMTPRPRRKLPTIVNLAGMYIHRNRVRGVFETARSLAAERLRDEYIDILEAFLRGRTPEVGQIFVSRGDLDQDVQSRATRLDPVLGELLVRPQLLAEAVIRDARLRRDDITTDELKEILAVYFNIASSELLPATEIFRLDLVAMLDTAFGRINVFRQLILRLSGRHDSLRRNYLRRFGTRGGRFSYANDGGPVAPGGGRTRAESQETPGLRTRGTGPRGHEPETVTPQRRSSVPKPPPKPKIKSPHELDKAWQDFDEALRIKPESPEDEFS